MKKPADSVNFHTLNNLLAFLSRSDANTADEVRSAINFTLENAMPGGPDEDSLISSAEYILRLHRLNSSTPFAFELLDFRTDDYDPLFLRIHVRNALRTLSGTAEALLLITGLRRMICPPGRNWTEKRQHQYEQAQSYIEDVAASSITPSTRLHMLFL